MAAAYSVERLLKAKKLFPPKSKEVPSAKLIRQAQGPVYNFRPRSGLKRRGKNPVWVAENKKDANYIPPAGDSDSD
ncbi:hypothetical protein N7466_004650 [Penicillium verhagenii]|uniref:uncharacterized protein n=1 Tax=Penicillium verhagenii TaxID=1562060 RepID=UPI002544E484|nr:uncharacterized protein N7466_004650 [Penicillium verhagenii]KAJ5935103.1 hypothetical protein N7466_004650 [Penicillium verhagenii]